MQILLVTHTSQDRRLQAGLADQGHGIRRVAGIGEAERAVAVDRPQIIILDVDFPGTRGPDTLSRLKTLCPAIPVLVLSGDDSAALRDACFERGADMYLLKPVAMPELLARVRVVERWSTGIGRVVVTVGHVSLDMARQCVFVDDRELPLPRKEYMLLKALMGQPGRVQSRDRLEAQLYSWGEDIASNALQVYVHNLRQKLGRDFIRTVRGLGYKVAGNPEPPGRPEPFRPRSNGG